MFTLGPDRVVRSLAIFLDAWMRRGEEGKLPAGAAGFYSPWGSESDEQGHRTLWNVSFVMQKEKRFALSAGSAFRFTPIRVREKRMNTLKTAKTLESYQEVSK